MKVGVQRIRGPLLASATLTFFAYALWTAHTPGEPRTVKDFLFVIGLFGVPFLVFVYSLLSLSGPTEIVSLSKSSAWTGRQGIATKGAVLGAVSASLLLLMLPFWDALIVHEGWGATWVITGIITAAAATLCGIVGVSKLRGPAIVSAVLLPFWLFAAGLLVKATLD